MENQEPWKKKLYMKPEFSNDFLSFGLLADLKHLLDLVKITAIIPSIKTDHAAISLELVNDSNDIKGPGLWKMNWSKLDDEDYVNDITEKIPIWLAEGRKDLSDRRSIWDWLKYNITAHTIQLSKSKARERNEREENLQEEYAKAKCIFETDLNDRNANTLNLAKGTLELFYEEKIKGIIIRARARWHEHGEKSTEHFLNLEKRNHIKKHMRKLNINGSITTDPFNTLNEQRSFYQELYTRRNKNNEAIESFLKDLLIPKLSEEQKMSCEGKITSEECAFLLECLKNNKTPGNVGIFIEFYKKF